MLGDYSDHQLYIFFVNNEPLLDRAIASVSVHFPVIVDNSSYGLRRQWIIRPLVPLTFSQSMNAVMTRARDNGRKFVVVLHSDAEAEEGSYEQLVNFARKCNHQERKWGALFTNYDSMVALNLELLDVVGQWDTNLHQYFSDDDYYRRIRLGGYECIDTGIQVKHTPSSTINSDPELRFLNSVTFPLYESYYVRKWGGKPGSEQFMRPFNR